MQAKLTSRELAHRAGDGVEVSLFWNEDDHGLTVAVADTRTGEEFDLAAHPENVLDVFYHPFAYAAFKGVYYRVDIAEALAA